ncbi:hypothetical protein U9M48_024860 [Paspalum notatum var. saurae]|uniref:Uncharacterized protein n=1 Tax=Paspalum notatum var. saurae TaxID=547442 RepID=A0AAQ3TMR3_PASNO
MLSPPSAAPPPPHPKFASPPRRPGPVGRRPPYTTRHRRLSSDAERGFHRSKLRAMPLVEPEPLL